MQGKDVKEIMAYMDQRDKERAENPFKRAEEFANAKAKDAVKTDTSETTSDAQKDANGDVPAMPTVGDDKNRNETEKNRDGDKNHNGEKMR